MPKTVLDVGNCVPDFASIRTLIEGNFDAKVIQAHGPEDTLETLKSTEVDLVLINRKLDRDYSDGVDILKQIKANEQLRSVPVMLITNFEEHQDAAVELGAERGFGKLEFQKPETHDKLSRLLA